MPLSRAFQRLFEGGLIIPLPPRPPPQPTPPGFRTDLHCAYHQIAGHDTDSCAALRHAIQDLIDQGLVDLGYPGVTTAPLPTHDTRAVPPPPGGIHSIEFLGDEIFMMGWDGEAPQPICLYPDSDFSEYTLGQQVSGPFRLIQDDFPLPHIDMLVDSTAGHPMLSFMDGFSRYNQILMALEDMEKTSFITEWGTYCYRVMPFGLKNAGATYQRAATTLFHDMMHKDVEVYVDDMIVKSQGRADHLAALQRFFERIRQFRLRLNPKKFTFGVTSGKLLGHIVNERGIEVDPEKTKAILDMPAPKTEKEIRGFLGRL